MSAADSNARRSATDNFEETLIAIFLGLMTLVTFANVVARYVFNDNILWALETTVFLFAWLVLLGTCYGVKKSLHLGIDIVIARLPERPRKIFGLVSDRRLPRLQHSAAESAVGNTGTRLSLNGHSLRSMTSRCPGSCNFSQTG